MRKSIATMLRKIRRAMKWSQEDLARELRTCLQSIRNWENGNQPSEIWAEKIRSFYAGLIEGKEGGKNDA